MEGEREGRRMAGIASFNSEQTTKYVAVVKYRASHNTAQKKKQEIIEKSNDLSCKSRKNMPELLGSNMNIEDPARQTNFKALWRSFNYPKPQMTHQ